MTSLEALTSKGYKIENGLIEKAGIVDCNGTAVVNVTLRFDAGGCSMDGHTCGQFLPKDKRIRGTRFGCEALLWLMAVAGVSSSSELGGQYVRVAFNPETERAEFIGHIFFDRWLSFDTLASRAL